jgi:hypothetical protein
LAIYSQQTKRLLGVFGRRETRATREQQQQQQEDTEQHRRDRGRRRRRRRKRTRTRTERTRDRETARARIKEGVEGLLSSSNNSKQRRVFLVWRKTVQVSCPITIFKSLAPLVRLLLLPTTTTTPCFFFFFWWSFLGLFGPSFVSCIVVFFIGDLWLGLSRERERERERD